MEEDDGCWLLPIFKLEGTEYLVDVEHVEHGEFREFKNPKNVVNMHSEQGRQIVNEIVGGQWDSFSVYSYPRKEMEI